MLLIKSIKQMVEYRRTNFAKKIGLVATMGSLHQAHFSLIEQIRLKVDVVVVSIFVNPKQFSPSEDFKEYPRDLKNDIVNLEKLKIDVLFTPLNTELYPNLTLSQSQIKFNFCYLSEILCSKNRKNFFSGVALIVSKLFNIIQPDWAIFGQKDYQQFKVIQNLVSELNFPVQLLMAPIYREKNKLALSSRNQYLTTKQKEKAGNIYKILLAAEIRIKKIPKDKLNLAEYLEQIKKLEKKAMLKLNSYGFRGEYFSILEYPSLLPVSDKKKQLIILLACYLNGVRLIDNKIIDFK